MPPKLPPHWANEETDDPRIADDCNFYKVETWTKDWAHLEGLLWAGNSLDKARAEFVAAVNERPWVTLRQRARVLDQWPRE